MKIEPPEGNQLDYYYDHDYFPDATKTVVESHGNTVLVAMGAGGDDGHDKVVQPTKKQTSVSKKQHHAKFAQDGRGTKKHKEKSPVGKKKPGVNGIGNTVLVAMGAGGHDGHGIQSSGMKKTYKQS